MQVSTASFWMLPATVKSAALPRKKTRGTASLSLQAVRCGGYRPCDPGRVEKRKPSGRTRGFADFFGASPVASALGIRSGATPGGPIHSNTTLGALVLSKFLLDTQRRTIHFYIPDKTNRFLKKRKAAGLMRHHACGGEQQDSK